MAKNISKRSKVSQKTESQIRCVTFNLKGLSADWFGQRMDAAVEGLLAVNPDVVCLQEATVRYLPDAYDQASELGKRIGLPYVAFCPYGNPIEIMSFEQGGVATLSRWPFQSVRFRRLPPGHEQPFDSRVALITTLALLNEPVHIVNTHLSWRPEESYIRLVQGGLILDVLMKLGYLAKGSRTILAGDFNSIEKEPCIQHSLEYLKDAYRERNKEDLGHTVSGANPLTADWDFPDRRLDYIFCSKDAKVKAAKVILDEPSPVYPSDHFGVMVDLDWN